MAFRYASILGSCSRTVIRDNSLALSRPQLNIGFLRRMCSKKEGELVNTPEPVKTEAPSTLSAAQTMGKGLTGHKTDTLDRIWLVWGGKFKSRKEVPNHVSQDTMEFYRNKARIKISIWMMIATLGGCLSMIWSGKLAAERGETIYTINEEFHRAYKLQKQKELEEAAAKGIK